MKTLYMITDVQMRIEDDIRVVDTPNGPEYYKGGQEIRIDISLKSAREDSLSRAHEFGQMLLDLQMNQTIFGFRITPDTLEMLPESSRGDIVKDAFQAIGRAKLEAMGRGTDKNSDTLDVLGERYAVLRKAFQALRGGIEDENFFKAVEDFL